MRSLAPTASTGTTLRQAGMIALLGAVLGLAVALFLLPTGLVFAITEIMIWVLFATSLNFLISYGGMISFGHAAYFGLGAYGLALSVVRFGLPLWIAIAAGPLIAALAAAIFGALCVRLTRIYFSMLTLACAEITFAVIFQWYDFTGGDTGIASFTSTRLGFDAPQYGLIVLAVVTLCLTLLWLVVKSPFGIALRAVGEDPRRAAASGFDPRMTLWAAFVISGFFAGIAGTLFALFHGNVFPDYAGLGFSLDVLVMVVIGGLHSFAGGIYGAIIYKLLDTIVSHYFTHWQLVIGLTLAAVIIFSPKGAAGFASRLSPGIRGGKTR
ncbi:branched-chain amino acid ABC transporter permease [Microvirga sp. G4-2]|uniref:branched-chain amino acid ABC transporter permease n=1 Tax=Microvirga sp. G4-2 TaxID=3434467 RepID=UPI004043EADB